MILAPDANQGPLIGIFITGPLGLLLGFLIGVTREGLGRKATPRDLIRAVDWLQVRRLGAAGFGALLTLRGAAALAAEAGRPAAASVVVGVMLLSYAALGQVPAWFRR
jgi:hypothetical protein